MAKLIRRILTVGGNFKMPRDTQTMMILQKNEEGTRSRQIDLLCKQHNTSRMSIASLFHDFTIPKGTIKNILNGNVRLLIDEYLYNIGISTYTFA